MDHIGTGLFVAVDMLVGIPSHSLLKQLFTASVKILLKVGISIVYDFGLIKSAHLHSNVLEVFHREIDGLSMQLQEARPFEGEPDNSHFSWVMSDNLLEATNGKHHIFQGIPSKVLGDTPIKDVVCAVFLEEAKLFGSIEVALGFSAKADTWSSLTAREDEQGFRIIGGFLNGSPDMSQE
jgi:hypothetical protein